MNQTTTFPNLFDIAESFGATLVHVEITHTLAVAWYEETTADVMAEVSAELGLTVSP